MAEQGLMSDSLPGCIEYAVRECAGSQSYVKAFNAAFGTHLRAPILPIIDPRRSLKLHDLSDEDAISLAYFLAFTLTYASRHYRRILSNGDWESLLGELQCAQLPDLSVANDDGGQAI